MLFGICYLMLFFISYLLFDILHGNFVIVLCKCEKVNMDLVMLLVI